MDRHKTNNKRTEHTLTYDFKRLIPTREKKNAWNKYLDDVKSQENIKGGVVAVVYFSALENFWNELNNTIDRISANKETAP